MQEAGIFDRCATDDDVSNTVIQIAFNGVEITNSTAKLHRNFVANGFSDGLDGLFIHWFTRKSTVQIDKVQSSRTTGNPFLRHFTRVGRKHRSTVHFALFKADTLPIF